MRQHPDEVPEPLRNKESILFLNVEEIHNFHKKFVRNSADFSTIRFSFSLFIKDLERYADSPEDVGHCFVTWVKKRNFLHFNFFFFVSKAKQFHIYYVEYCKNNETCIKLLTQYRGPFFEVKQKSNERTKISIRLPLRFFKNIQHKYQIDTINSYLIKPVQRITKYELLLQRLMSCCEESKGEVKEGYDLMCNVPKKANDAMHLSYLEELEVCFP